MVIKFRKDSFYRTVFLVLLFDLVLGGSGRIITFGPLSFRYVLFLFVGLIELYVLIKDGIPINSACFLTMFFLAFLSVQAAFSLMVNSTGNVADEFLGYLPLLLFFFFGYCFLNNLINVIDVKRVFVFASLLLSLISVILWGVAFLRGTSVYQAIEVGILRRYDIGRLAFAGSLVRLFMKGTIFCAISFVFNFYEWISVRRNKGLLLAMILNLIAVIISFTLGIYISVAVGIILVFFFFGKGKKRTRMIILFVLSIAIGVVVATKFGIVDLMKERFSGEYTLSYKSIQTKALVKDMLNSPLFGNGMGHELTIDYGYTMNRGFRAENMWGEMLNHYGLVGTLIFLTMIFVTFGSLRNKTKSSENPVYVLFAIGIVMLAIESLSNPFLNNAIGLTYLAVCIGMTLDSQSILMMIE